MNSFVAPSLRTAFGWIPDARRRQGRRYSLPAMMTQAIAAKLANPRSVLAVTEWAADQSLEELTALRFPDRATPHQSALGRPLARLDPLAVANCVNSYLTTTATTALTGGQHGIAIDGEDQRERQEYRDPPTGVVKAVSPLCHESRLVVGEVPVEHRGEMSETELTVAPRLIAQFGRAGRIAIGDARSANARCASRCVTPEVITCSLSNRSSPSFLVTIAGCSISRRPASPRCMRSTGTYG